MPSQSCLFLLVLFAIAMFLIVKSIDRLKNIGLGFRVQPMVISINTNKVVLFIVVIAKILSLIQR